MKRPSGRPQGGRVSEADVALLVGYDHRAADLTGRALARLPREIATEFKNRKPNWYPGAVESVETRLRRLIKGYGGGLR
jgi:hypothetical protein